LGGNKTRQTSTRVRERENCTLEISQSKVQRRRRGAISVDCVLEKWLCAF
jgi:hypothetical protein